VNAARTEPDLWLVIPFTAYRPDVEHVQEGPAA
jgi:hypothetical protein